MRILITLFSTSWGGAEQSILDLSSQIVIKGHKVIVLWVSNNKQTFKINNKPRVKIIRLQINPRIYKYLSPYIVAIICLMYRIQIVNLNWRFVDEEARFLKLLNIKAVPTIRAILLDRKDCSEFKRTDAVIGISEASSKRLQEIGYSKKIYTIPNGLDTNRFLDPVKKKFNRKKILVMSRLVGWKRVDWSIKAVHKLRKEGLPLTLDIYGEGPEYNQLENLIKKLKASNYIKLSGYIDNKDEALADYGIFLISSLQEPFGKTIVENAIQGRVIVGSNSGGIPEILPDYPLLFDYLNFKDYVEKIRLAFTKFSVYQKNIQSRKNNLVSYYSLERLANDYVKTFENILFS